MLLIRTHYRPQPQPQPQTRSCRTTAIAIATETDVDTVATIVFTNSVYVANLGIIGVTTLNLFSEISSPLLSYEGIKETCDNSAKKELVLTFKGNQKMVVETLEAYGGKGSYRNESDFGSKGGGKFHVCTFDSSSVNFLAKV